MTDVELSDLRHRDILDIAGATVVGRVEGLALDDAHENVVALIVGKGPKGSPLLPWDRVVAIGPDAVTIDGIDALRAPDGPAEQRAASGDLDPLGKSVLSDQGDASGHLTDLVFDSVSGALTFVVVEGEARPAADLVAIGGYVAVVRAPT